MDEDKKAIDEENDRMATIKTKKIKDKTYIIKFDLCEVNAGLCCTCERQLYIISYFLSNAEHILLISFF